MAETIAHAGSTWKLTRLPSALEASRNAVNRIRPWISSTEEQRRRQDQLAHVRRQNGIPDPGSWMW